MAKLKVVGARTPKLNGPDIVTGRTIYADDVQLPGTLHGRILHSPHGHARIRAIDTAKARALPGVVDVVTAADIPDLSLLASDEVCHEGQKVALVAAVDPDIAEDALALIKVEYEVLPSVTDPEAAMAPGAPEVMLGAPTETVVDENGERLSNIASRSEMVEGDVDKGFAEADVIVEQVYRMPYFHQVYMEPNSATARVEANGRITVWTSGQGSFNIRNAVAGALKLPQGQVRVIMAEMGGGFGAKNGIFTEAHAALLAQRTGQPVKVLMSREEEFLDGRPAPGCVVRLKTGAKKDGTLTAVEGRMVWDRGIGGGGGGVGRLTDIYEIANVKLEGLVVRTNKPAPGAYRAPGAPQAAVPREGNMDLLARELGMDPLAIRLKNAFKKGGRARGGAPLPRDWLRQTLRQAAGEANWGKRRLKPNQGMGIACGEWQNAAGQTNAFITMAGDGSVSIVTGQVDITGVHTVMAQIAAEELGVPVEKVSVSLGDTDTVPFTGLSAGSKAAYSAGTAARDAAVEARTQLLRLAAELLEADVDDLILADEKVRVKGRRGRSIELAELANNAIGSNDGPISGRCVLGRIPTYASFSVNIATVEVDPDTGQVQLLDLVAAQDVGRALNPMLVEGQIQGAAVQAMGFGMMEAQRYGAGARMLNANLLDYAIPTTVDVPKVRTVLVEDPCEMGPYGAKGVGEPPIIPGAAAIANAVHDAIGVRVSELPLTPETVMKALRRQPAKNKRKGE
ncbi:MAG TPA: xanthine dehydrogenase family protein molybdopterin-binding subunit [Candidatus Latescibacteria bacterium]|jgi:CO/xanthine dehydrogenase Mo-binding subunit|nr:hypothetical protein [Gemmatimonadaceae bacterium]MDP6017231.1 xanthine dehydrogenase family protein molybdopterin-binding subunit [Candidatus Latescibacterota bacterium]HJP33007.1 xanthine dehydrogenase family protein molybdopterin-binding subunit [Candidatus Latescibacterota bacterium]